MSLELLNPDTLPAPFGYTQVVRGRGSTTLYTRARYRWMRGATSWARGSGGTIAAGVRDLVAAVEAGGGRLEQLAKITAFIVGYEPDHR